MKIRLLVTPVLLALVASLAACGGSQSVPSNAVAVVNGTPITIAKFNVFLAQAMRQAKAQGQTVSPGTPQYASLRSQVVAGLVQLTKAEQLAAKDKISVSQQEVTKGLADIAKLYYGGSMKKLLAAYQKQGLGLQAVRQQKYLNLLGTKLENMVTSTAKVTQAQELAYYKSNPSMQTTQPTLDVAASKKLANTIERKLKSGMSFATLAKKYSQDTGSASQGGKYTATGKEVPAYDRAAFSLKTGQLSGLVDATSSANGGYGFFIIKPLAPAKTAGGQKTRNVEHILVAVKTKPKSSTFKQAQAQIQQILLNQQKQTLWSQWLSDLQKNGKVTYQSGFAPPATTAISTTG
jgi:parvulin-like peptidyl-prolyl isomerase